MSIRTATCAPRTERRHAERRHAERRAPPCRSVGRTALHGIGLDQRNVDPLMLDFFAAYDSEQLLRSHRSPAVLGVVDGGEARLEILGQVDVVEADERDFLADPDALAGSVVVQADGHFVVEAEHARRAFVPLQNDASGFLAGAFVEVAFDDDGFQLRMAVERLPDGDHPLARVEGVGRPRHDVQLAVPRADEIVHGEIRAGLVVEQHLVHGGMIELPVEHDQLVPAVGIIEQLLVREGGVENDGSVDHPLRQQAMRLHAAADDQVIALAVEHFLHSLQQIAVECAREVGQERPDDPGFLLLELAGRRIGNIVQLLGDGQNLGAGFGCDLRTAVQRIRDRRNRHSGLLGDILDADHRDSSWRRFFFQLYHNFPIRKRSLSARLRLR
ncbi:hypothetical protein BN871_EP_00140 [Paenibacillus sp. P22]|nr:hypothetical protein BN871_EP_00140 [Paenibacillus sp. P22]